VLEGADLSGALLNRTVFANCEDLGLAHGLQAIVHRGPSCLDLATLRAGLRMLPEEFLRGAGVTLEEIEALRGASRPQP
jgi:hypothetical protein